jgi:integrating conjugative element protein (TIGR03759 family)
MYVFVGLLVFSLASAAGAQKSVQQPVSVLPTLVIKPELMKPEETANEQNTESQATKIKRWGEQAKIWGVTLEDWQRFEELKKGPRGYWSPGLDPLTTLGVEARSENERVKYAQIQVRMEAERAERELAYQRTYNAVFQKVYGDMLLVNPPADAKKSASLPPRVALFVKPNCPECDKKAKKLQADKTPFDIYMVDAGGSDSAIRDWAKKVGINPALVQSKTITLNHDNGTLKSIGGSTDKLPAVFQLAEGSGLWVRVD